MHVYEYKCDGGGGVCVCVYVCVCTFPMRVGPLQNRFLLIALDVILGSLMSVLHLVFCQAIRSIKAWSQ